jgi:PQQ-dependent dehydrogenase (methanol/ethanol family)
MSRVDREKKINGVLAGIMTAIALSPAVLTLGILAGAAQPRADTPSNPFAKDPTAVETGRAIFNGTCSACHGEGATGGRGPALNSGEFLHGSEDYDLFQTIRAGIPGTQMPNFASFPSDDIWRVISYIRSLSRPLQEGLPAGNAKAGEVLFFGAGGCSQCHEVNGRGMDLASDLSGEGSKSAGAIQDGVLHRNLPHPLGQKPPRFVAATLTDGGRVEGIVKEEDSFSLHLESRDGKFFLLDRDNITALTDEGPAASAHLSDRLSSSQIADLVAYLAAHKTRDLGETAKFAPQPVLSYARIANSAAEPQNWLTYWGDYRGHHFSELRQINPSNVAALQARWTAQMLGENVLEATPIVVDGVMYVTGSPGDVAAFDARSGLLIWRFHRRQDLKNPYQINPFNRGVAVLDGRVFFGTLDNNLIALDAHTGRELWEERINDTMGGFTITGAPLALKDKIIVGMSGGEMGVRGYLEAYDPASGKKLWRFWTVPGPGDPAVKSWQGSSWQYGAAATWLTGSYDAETNTIIWGTGNPAPDYNADVRKGDNLYSDSVIALDADSGKLKWYYQFTPNDPHDWDAEEDMVLADQMIGGHPRKLLLHADRNGFFYVLDRVDGKFLWAKPFVRQNWNKGFEEDGRPIIDPKSAATPAGQTVLPGGGATNFQAPSYDQDSGLFYLEFSDAEGLAISAPAVYERGKQYLGRGVGSPPPGAVSDQGVMALDSKTGAPVWKFSLTRGSTSAGLVATRGGLVFAATTEGQFIALEANTGRPLWHFSTGGAVTASPIVYAVDGEEFVAISAGNMIYSFALPPSLAQPEQRQARYRR